MAEDKSESDRPVSIEQPVSFFNSAFVQFSASAWLLQLVFGDMGKIAGGAVLEIPRFIVGLPWPLAKVLHQILGETIRQYETTEGEITLPNSVRTQLEKQIAAFKKQA